jgi:hypothetical protein
VLRKISGPEKDEIKCKVAPMPKHHSMKAYSKLCSKATACSQSADCDMKWLCCVKYHIMRTESNSVVKSRTYDRLDVTKMGETRNAYRILVSKPLEKCATWMLEKKVGG